MRRPILLATLIATLCLCFGVASASAASPTRAEFNSLKSKVNRLQAQTSNLRRRIDAVEACAINVIPVARFGGFTTEGYVYRAPAAEGFVPALDVVDDITGLEPGNDFAWFQIVDPACVDAFAGRPASTAAPRVPHRLLFLRR